MCRCVRASWLHELRACACGGKTPTAPTLVSPLSSLLSALPQDPKDQWKNWIAYDAPFTEQTDELNRARHFFWEVDAKVCAPKTCMCVCGVCVWCVCVVCVCVCVCVWCVRTPILSPKELHASYLTGHSSFFLLTSYFFLLPSSSFKGRLWRKELHAMEERFGEMKDARVLDYFFARVQV